MQTIGFTKSFWTYGPSQSECVSRLNRLLQLTCILTCGFALKQYYSTANPNELRWILAPTTALVQMLTGIRFQFEDYTGYINSDHTFVIAASCAGVNFLLASFLLLSLTIWWKTRARSLPWHFIVIAAASAFLTTLVANTVRISIALWMQRLSFEALPLTRDELHRLEGIIVYFVFLLLLFLIGERVMNYGSQMHQRSRYQRWVLPLSVYYAVTLAMPLANVFFHGGIAPQFRQHSLFVIVVPLMLLLPPFILPICWSKIASPHRHCENAWRKPASR